MVGQFKNDTLKYHAHGAVNVAGYVSLGAVGAPSWSDSATYRVQLMGPGANTIALGAGDVVGDDSVTHGKQKGVKYISFSSRSIRPTICIPFVVSII